VRGKRMHIERSWRVVGYEGKERVESKVYRKLDSQPRQKELKEKERQRLSLRESFFLYLNFTHTLLLSTDMHPFRFSSLHISCFPLHKSLDTRMPPPPRSPLIPSPVLAHPLRRFSPIPDKHNPSSLCRVLVSSLALDTAFQEEMKEVTREGIRGSNMMSERPPAEQLAKRSLLAPQKHHNRRMLFTASCCKTHGYAPTKLFLASNCAFLHLVDIFWGLKRGPIRLLGFVVHCFDSFAEISNRIFEVSHHLHLSFAYASSRFVPSDHM